MLPLLPYALGILIAFFTYGGLVRNGKISGRAVVTIGSIIGVVAVLVWTGATYATLSPAARHWTTIVPGAVVMGVCAFYCVAMAYRVQNVETVAEFLAGDTKMILLGCTPMRLPDADALIVPCSTAIAPMGGPVLTLLAQAGGEVGKELKPHKPLGVGKCAKTSGGKLAVGSIWWCSVHEPSKNADVVTVRRTVEKAAESAKRDGAESLVVLFAAVRGLSLEAVASASVEGVVKQRRAFAEIVFVVTEPRDQPEAKSALESTLRKLVPDVSIAG